MTPPLRDQIQDRAYFDERMSLFDIALDRIPERRSRIKPERLPHLEHDLWRTDFHLLQCRYSTGDAIDDLRPRFSELVAKLPSVELFKFVPNPMAAYGDTVWLCSWAILLDDAESLSTLASVVDRDGHRDYLLDSFFGREPESATLDALTYGKIHDGLLKASKLAVAGHDDEASETLRDYVSRYWYNKHQGSDWHGRHQGGFYVGYWCYEAAATAKVFGIDDSPLQGHKYYPCDLVSGVPSCGGR